MKGKRGKKRAPPSWSLPTFFLLPSFPRFMVLGGGEKRACTEEKKKEKEGGGGGGGGLRLPSSLPLSPVAGKKSSSKGKGKGRKMHLFLSSPFFLPSTLRTRTKLWKGGGKKGGKSLEKGRKKGKKEKEGR